ncbi:unannotated protein [freshwater metagenome]|uniref:Unannotated protein n=1 Tax=freshwater metagenome TaxID=449393 RepID=A0A6J6FVX6_9ZZZZ
MNYRGAIGQGGQNQLAVGEALTSRNGNNRVERRGCAWRDPIFALSGINAGRHWFRLYARNSPTRAGEKEYAIESRIMVTDETPEDNEILAGEEANAEDIVIPGSLEWDPSEIETNYVNRGSFEEVYNSVYPRLYRHTVYELDRLYLSKKKVEEVLQTAMGKAYQNWDKYTQGTYALGWLKKIITNTAYNLLRKEKNEPLLFGDMGIVMDAPAYYARSAESAVIESVTFDEIRALFDDVREPFRSALKLVILEEMPYQDAADKVGVPLNTMLTRVNRGRAILKELVLTHKKEMGI